MYNIIIDIIKIKNNNLNLKYDYVKIIIYITKVIMLYNYLTLLSLIIFIHKMLWKINLWNKKKKRLLSSIWKEYVIIFCASEKNCILM